MSLVIVYSATKCHSHESDTLQDFLERTVHCWKELKMFHLALSIIESQIKKKRLFIPLKRKPFLKRFGSLIFDSWTNAGRVCCRKWGVYPIK